MARTGKVLTYTLGYTGTHLETTGAGENAVKLQALTPIQRNRHFQSLKRWQCNNFSCPYPSENTA